MLLVVIFTIMIIPFTQLLNFCKTLLLNAFSINIGSILHVFQSLSSFLMAIILCLTVILAVARIIMSSLRGFPMDKIAHTSKTSEYPSISIHIPFCNEPSEMVIDTIKSCLGQQYPNFEIIVLSNNTEDINLWKPVRAFCKNYPDQIRFEHYTHVEGYKGGALDICRSLTGSAVEYLFTVDADYILHPFALRKAVRHLKYTGAQLLQFPQNYSKENHTAGNAMHKELYSYFEIYSKIGNLTCNALPTGTLSLIALHALDAVKGWSGRSITEDAELGVKFWQKGFRTCFISEILGKGRLPNSISDLLKQRARWIFGNSQALRGCFAKDSGSAFSRLTIFLQLTAWSNLMALPLILLLMQGILWGLMINTTILHTGFILALTSLTVHLLSQFLLLGIATNFSGKYWWGAFLARTALLDLGSFQWIPALFGAKRPFECTNKFSKDTSFREVPMLLPGLFLTLTILTMERGLHIVYVLIPLFLLFSIASVHLYFQFKTRAAVLKTQLN